ncbi:polycystic kidney disease 1-like protein [Plakobranchus ocellatus]|uniref:Polycystic kidney disease 1-like protein n=1 Tax=Plakobranchus ocellatus TaxID=259542 RepID=A0AAV4AE48_9GAST|nr:polycystic kidney disease 1-like protein [Plakobranchus ocellatus]
MLEDNMDQDIYMYLICVTTGWSVSAGTSSKVYMYLKGSWADSRSHCLFNSNQQLFQRGARNWFLLTTPDDIGDLLSVVVWTDFSGTQPSWSVHLANSST